MPRRQCFPGRKKVQIMSGDRRDSESTRPSVGADWAPFDRKQGEKEVYNGCKTAEAWDTDARKRNRARIGHHRPGVLGGYIKAKDTVGIARSGNVLDAER